MGMSTWRRSLAVGVVAATVAGAMSVGAGTAAAASTSGEGLGELITEFETFTIAGNLRLDPKTGASTLVDVNAITGLVDRAGKAIGSLSSVPVALPRVRTGPDIGRFSCIKQGSARNFTAFDRTEILYNDNRGIQQYQFHPYRKTSARGIAGNAWSTQYEVCGTGGADLKNGYRAYQTGLGFAYPDANRTYRIGYNWKSGKTPEDYTLTMGFQLGGTETIPASISAGISQNPSDKLMGSFNAPYPDARMDSYARNGVNAWWQDSCVSGWSRCKLRADGSPNFQGTVAHGLYEFTPAQARTVREFAINSYLQAKCHGMFGCR